MAAIIRHDFEWQRWSWNLDRGKLETTSDWSSSHLFRGRRFPSAGAVIAVLIVDALRDKSLPQARRVLRDLRHFKVFETGTIALARRQHVVAPRSGLRPL